MVNEKLISVLDQIAKHVEIENTKNLWNNLEKWEK